MLLLHLIYVYFTKEIMSLLLVMKLVIVIMLGNLLGKLSRGIS